MVLKNILASPKFSSKYKSSFDEVGATLGKNSLGNQSMAAVEAKHCRMMRIKQDDTTNLFIVARFSPLFSADSYMQLTKAG